VSTTPFFYYQFDYSDDWKTDRMGICPPLVDNASAGHSRCWYYDYLAGWCTRGGGSYLTTSPTKSAAYQKTGALTLEIMFCANVAHLNYEQELVSCANSLLEPGGTGNNHLYAIVMLGGSGVFGVIEYHHHDSAQAKQQAYPCGVTQEIEIITITRDADGDVDTYQNGNALYSKALNTPFGGANGYLQFGINFHGTIFCARAWDVQFTADQVKESYQRARGII